MDPKAGDKVLFSRPRTTEAGAWAVPESVAATITATHPGGLVDLTVERAEDGTTSTVTGVPYSGELYQARDKSDPKAPPVPYSAPGTWRWADGGPTDKGRVDASPAVVKARAATGAAAAAPVAPPARRTVTRTTEPTKLGGSDR